jgi:hypothetical protein
MADPAKRRDWLLTRIWSAAMDALAIGLIVLVLTGPYQWYGLTSKRHLGLVLLGAGSAVCAFFLFGLALVF